MTQPHRRLIRGVKAVIQDVPWAQRSIRSMQLAIGSVHEQELKLLPYLADPSRMAVDVGGSVGSYTHALLNLGCPVTTFEANPKLAKNLHRMYGNDASIVWAAVSDSAGTITLRIPTEAGIATVHPHNDLNGVAVQEITVPCVTLDEALTERVGFIKIDVEGHELAVLHGAMRLLERDRPTLLIEAEERHRTDAVASIRDLLGPLDYGGFMLDGGRLVGISQFDAARDQSPADIAALNAGRYTGRYINNFLFIRQ